MQQDSYPTAASSAGFKSQDTGEFFPRKKLSVTLFLAFARILMFSVLFFV